MNPYRPEFEEALRVFASISESIEEAGFQRPILVGGAAVELYSGSAIATGDFDIVTARQDVLERALLAHGFEKPTGRGVLMRGWVHSGLRLGFEIVGTALLDGHADRDTVQLIDAGTGDQFAVISVEDLIADRMGQYHSGTALRCLNKRKRCSTFIKTLILPIWNGVFVKRLQTIMASRNLNQPCRAISLDDFRRDVARRREAVSEAEMPRNSGQRRTKSKQELLIAIQAAGGNW